MAINDNRSISRARISITELDNALQYQGETLALRFVVSDSSLGTQTSKIDIEADMESSDAWKAILSRFDGKGVELIPYKDKFITQEEKERGKLYRNLSSNRQVVKQAVDYVIKTYGVKEEQESYFNNTKLTKAEYVPTVRRSGQMSSIKVAGKDDKLFRLKVSVKIRDKSGDALGVQNFKGFVSAIDEETAKNITLAYFMEEYHCEIGDVIYQDMGRGRMTSDKSKYEGLVSFNTVGELDTSFATIRKVSNEPIAYIFLGYAKVNLKVVYFKGTVMSLQEDNFNARDDLYKAVEEKFGIKKDSLGVVKWERQDGSPNGLQTELSMSPSNVYDINATFEYETGTDNFIGHVHAPDEKTAKEVVYAGFKVLTNNFPKHKLNVTKATTSKPEYADKVLTIVFKDGEREVYGY